MGCQKEIAARIIDQRGDYVLFLKENQPTCYADVNELFLEGLESDFQGMKHQQWETAEHKGHGRTERHTYHLIQPSKQWLAKHPQWKGLKTVGMVYSERHVDGQEGTDDTRFFISSLSLDVRVFAQAVRGHWGIEPSHCLITFLGQSDAIALYADETGADKGFVLFQAHDFSFRGMSGPQDAALSGVVHLTSSVGTDTVAALDLIEDYYHGDAEKELIGCSVPATEHTVMSMGGSATEIETFRRLITQLYPKGIVSIVSDTWDFWKVITEYAAELKVRICFGAMPCF